MPPETIAKGKFEVIKRLGAGCFAEVYLGRNTKQETPVAIKVESRRRQVIPVLAHEAAVINALRTGSPPQQGFAEFFFYGMEGAYNCMVVELLGKSLEDQMQACKGKLTAKTTGLIAEQLFQRIEYLHSRGFLHRDIKPENFMFGINDKVHHLHIIDFGLSKRYWDDRSHQHAPMKERKLLTGTVRYASINCHKGIEQSRRDDLEAIAHMIMYFLRGSLPWSGLEAKTHEQKLQKILEKKEQTTIESLCQGFPRQFADLLSYARDLEYTEKPDYSKLYTDVRELRQEDCQDHSFQWFEKEDPPQRLIPLEPRTSYPQPDDEHEKRVQVPRASFCTRGCFDVMFSSTNPDYDLKLAH